MKKGRIIQADTLFGLAALAGLDAATLQDVVDTYNADIATTGKDSRFERKALAHEYGELVPVQSAPFYGYLCTASINSTYAGLCVNPSMAVLNVYGETIAGLFAAGEVVGGFHGEAYMTGSSLVKALVFGKTAARTALNATPLRVVQQEEVT
jgi:fumarate reductase flavoprotein subunit